MRRWLERRFVLARLLPELCRVHARPTSPTIRGYDVAPGEMKPESVGRGLVNRPLRLKDLGPLGEDFERQVGTFGDVEQGMAAVGEIEHPKHGQVLGRDILFPPDASIKPAPSQLRFALRDRIAVDSVVLDDIDRLDDHAIGFE